MRYLNLAKKMFIRLPVVGYIFRIIYAIFLLPRTLGAIRHAIHDLNMSTEKLQSLQQNTNLRIIEIIDEQKNKK